MGPMLAILLGLALIGVIVGLVVFVVIPAGRGVFWLIGRIFQFVSNQIADAFRFVGSILVMLVLVPVALFNGLAGKRDAAVRQFRAVGREAANAGVCVYRLALGNLARLLGVSAWTAGVEKRLPEALDTGVHAGAYPAKTAGAFDEPIQDRAGARTANEFPGYRIVGTLPTGGSGARLFIAEPDQPKRQELDRAVPGWSRTHHENTDSGAALAPRVVIKCFSIREGSNPVHANLVQIVREGRAIPAARKLGLILEHELTQDRFFYVTRYVPGLSLARETERMHIASTMTSAGLDDPGLTRALAYASDLLRSLELYHAGGLFHKDVKPDNVIVADDRAHLVDFGLVTPMASTMTLTTHGTEYFRDPEMVRQALRGAKVHEIDGARFDVYAVGAVLYSIIENSFPAHGGLSAIAKRCPECVKWIVRRAMTDYDKRYANASAMLRDIQQVLAKAQHHPDGLWLAKPSDLPSFAAEGLEAPNLESQRRNHTDPAPAPSLTTSLSTPHPMATPTTPGVRKSASEQVASARARAADRRSRATARMSERRAQVHSAWCPRPGRPGSGRSRAKRAAATLVGLSMIAAPLGLGIYLLRVGRSASAGSQVRAPDPLDGAWILGRADDDVPGVLNGAGRSPRADAGVVPAGTRVLVLRDPVSYENAHKADIDARLQSLDNAGFSLLGEAGDRNQPAQTEIAASLRGALGVLTLGSSEARAAIQEYLRTHAKPEPIAIIIWIGRGEAGELAVWCIKRDGLEPKIVRAAAEALSGS